MLSLRAIIQHLKMILRLISIPISLISFSWIKRHKRKKNTVRSFCYRIIIHIFYSQLEVLFLVHTSALHCCFYSHPIFSCLSVYYQGRFQWFSFKRTIIIPISSLLFDSIITLQPCSQRLSRSEEHLTVPTHLLMFTTADSYKAA